MTGTYSWLVDALESGADIVTANKRLARELRQAFDERQIALGLQSWPTPRILPWTGWTGTLLDRCDASLQVPLRIHPRAAALIWERLLEDQAGDRLLHPQSLVRQVQQTWQSLHDWCVPVADLHRHATSDDERLFADLAVAYQQQLHERVWLDYAQTASFVTRLIEGGKIAISGPVVYAGFDRVAPAAARLFHAYGTRGARVTEAPHTNRNRSVRVLSCTDGDAELRAAGLWGRRLLQEDAAAAVAIVCPGLEQNAPRAARLVREGLAPGWQYADEGRRAAVNVSYGRRLSQYPLIAVALLWLSWTCRGLPARDVSVLLRTPYAGRAVTDGRCRLEAVLRRLPDRSWRPASLAAALRGLDQSSESIDWLQRVELVSAMESKRATLESPGMWAGRIDQLLQELGWPGDKALDSAEFQLANRWRELLNELSMLDVVQPRIGLPEALVRLSAFAADTIYQPETEPGSVRLLGMLEAAGLEFDNLWVCHLDTQQWPPPAHPLPLISRALQRKLGMPDATPADTLEYSRRTLTRLAQSASSLTFSWPAADQDLQLEASPLLTPFIASGQGAGEDPGWFAASLRRGKARRAPGDPAPPVRPGERVSGGAATVQRQAADPFSAFAYGRLGVKDLQSIEYGLPASTRGNIVHRALQHLLAENPSSPEIAAWAEDLDGRIEGAVDAALARHLRFADGVLLRLLAIERKRLRAMLRKFHAAETLRQPFRVVAVERTMHFQRYGVELELRVDRIDRLDDGSLLVADYKTGAVKTLLTKNGEPKELQLVVYASALNEPVGALLLINVDSRDVVYRGVGRSREWERSPPELWDARLDRWMRLVDDALAQLAAGDVRLNAALTTLQTRPLNVLSRIEEIRRGR